MIKPGDLRTKKTIHELVKEFPEKTYRQLEKYRDADRQEEAQRIITQQENEELKDNQLTESQRKQAELEPIEETWQDKYDLEHRLRQEAETETILVKGIGINSPEMKAANLKIEEMRKELDTVKLENNNLFNNQTSCICFYCFCFTERVYFFVSCSFYRNVFFLYFHRFR